MNRWPKAVLIVLAVLLVALLVGPFLVPIPPLQGTLPPERLADPDSQFATLQGVRVHYKQTGEGQPALLLLDAHNIQQAILVGNSAGGTVSVLAALNHPERVKALILVDPAIYQGRSAAGSTHRPAIGSLNSRVGQRHFAAGLARSV